MSTILTNQGVYFPILNPHMHRFSLEEIAHALSHQCRFTGHTKQFYSVAQHSVHVALQVPHSMRFDALLHDASEAYLGDVSSPLKALLPEYKAIEKAVEAAIECQFELRYAGSPEIKLADMRMLMTEKRDLLPHAKQRLEWPAYDPYEFRVVPMDSVTAKAWFLEHAYRFIKEQS